MCLAHVKSSKEPVRPLRSEALTFTQHAQRGIRDTSSCRNSRPLPGSGLLLQERLEEFEWSDPTLPTFRRNAGSCVENRHSEEMRKLGDHYTRSVMSRKMTSPLKGSKKVVRV